MRLKLTLKRIGDGGSTDLLATFDANVTVGDLANAIAERDPSTSGRGAGKRSLRVEGADVALAAATAVADTDLRSGATVAVVDDPGDFGVASRTATAAEIVVIHGPDAGHRFPLRVGANYVGRERGSDVRLTDPLVSKRHARISLSDTVEIVDLGSANGVQVGDALVSRALLRPTDEITLGDSVVQVAFDVAAIAEVVDREGVAFNRSPSVLKRFAEREIEAPEPPERPSRQRFPWIPMLAPILMGCLLFAVTRQLYSILFVALSPIMALGNVLETRYFAKRSYREAEEAFGDAITALRADLERGRADEKASRLAEHPATAELVSAAIVRSDLLWSRRPDRPGFLDVRLGLGTQPSRTDLRSPRRSASQSPEGWRMVDALAAEFETIDGVPAVAALGDVGSVGVAGPRDAALSLARAVVASAAASHSPAEVSIGIVTSSARESDWQWAKWLPHVADDHARLSSEHLASSPGAATRLVASVEELVEHRLLDSAATTNDARPLPALLLVVDDSPIDRSRLVDLSERGPTVGVHVLWVAGSRSMLPAACRAYVDVDPSLPTHGILGLVNESWTGRIELERLSAEQAESFARNLSPVFDAGARVEDASDLPRSLSLLALLGTDIAHDASAVLERWRASGSLPGSPRRKKGAHLRAAVGAGLGETFTLDLQEHGPHALVGGTTGSGKSEFLQSWVMAMAAEYSPSQLTFLFVDYKGGAAFGACVELPHAVGLVTDLSPHLVQRALISLNAELRHREHILQAKKAKDLRDLEGDPEAPPRLVIVVDEFAALVAEVPEFVDGVVNVAQRGRSLGLHLVLATQRPAGVIKDNLRANTNLRIALRVADEDDSRDVVGSAQAAEFDPSIPGRGIAKTGPGRLVPFQAGYLGGWTSDEPEPPTITIQELPFGAGRVWERPDGELATSAPDQGPNDLRRLVASVRAAAAEAQLPAPRRPWLPQLAEVYDLARLPQSRTDSELVFAVLDDPERQRQVPVAFFPDREGNMAIFGTGGTGKTTALRTLAIAAGLATRSGPCHVYALDFAGRGLEMLTPLPHVGAVISGDDHERLTRLLRWLRGVIDDRAARFATHAAGNIVEYRQLAGDPEEARILVLLDGMAAFRSAYDAGDRVRWLDLLNAIASEGRQVGVHLVVTSDRSTSVPPSLASAIQRRLVLRMANEQDFAMADVDDPAALASAPPGRGLLGDDEIQVAVLGGTPNVQLQAQTIRRVAEELERAVARPAPAPIGRLTDRIALGELPASVAGLPTLGVADDTLSAIGFALDDPLLVTGPAGSGVTSTLAMLIMSFARATSGALPHFIGSARTPLHQLSEVAGRSVAYPDALAFADAFVGEINAGKFKPGQALLVVEDIGDVMSEGLENAFLDVLRACAGSGVGFVAHADPSIAGGFAPLLQALRAKRHGLALQPEQHEGDQIFKSPFPRITRSEFPVGRGFYIRRGAVVRVQCALPEIDI